VSERERTDPTRRPSTDIEFDFFDESPTAEAAREGAPRRRRRLPKRPPAPPGGPQLYRLGILIAGAIVLAVILILVVNSCRANQKEAEYRDYVEDVGEVTTQSDALGRQLNQRLNTPGIRLEDLRGAVEGLSRQQEQVLGRAQELSPPGPLVQQQEELIQTMQLRVNGLDGLAAAFARVAEVQNAQRAGQLLAQQASRLVASDVVYDDLFKTPTMGVLEQQDVSDIVVPDSNFARNPDLGSPTQWELVVQRLTQTPQSGGLRGNGIAGVVAQPGNQQLSQGDDNTVRASESLSFEVSVQNSGDTQETQVRVRLTIQQSPEPIRREQVIDSINPGQTLTVTFRDPGQVSFETDATLQVQVEPVPGETNTNNNTAEYPVTFTLG
jgi:CARDB